MDFIDDLDLPVDLPDSLEFSLDDILDEYGTLGLASGTARFPDEAPLSDIETRYTEERDLDILSESSSQPNTPDTDEPSSYGDPFGLSDILDEFADELDEDGVKVYAPSGESTAVDADKLKVYSPANETDLLDEEELKIYDLEHDADLFDEDDLKVYSPGASRTSEGALPEEPVIASAPAEDPQKNAKKKRWSLKEWWNARKQAKKAAAEAKRNPAPAEPIVADLNSPSAEEQTAELFAEIEAEQLLAEQLAEEEAMKEALAEQELFDWIESTSKPQGKDKETEYVPVPEYVPEPDLSPAQPQDLFAMPSLEQEDVLRPEYATVMEQDEAVEEGASLLENPDIDAEPTSLPDDETPEEAARRRAQEDAELAYEPDPTPAQAISSAIGKRFGSMFSFFDHSGDTDDYEDELGPEVSPGKASRYYNKYISGYRSRLHLATILCLIVGWISLGFPVFGAMKNTMVSTAMCLAILLTVMFLGADIFAVGLRNLLRNRAGVQSLVAASCVASVADAVVIILSRGEYGYLPFCGVSAISMCFAIYGSLLYCRGQRMNFRILDQNETPMTINVDFGIVDEDTTTAYRTAGHPEEYIHRSEEEDLSETTYSSFAPLLVVLIPLLALFAALVTKGFDHFFHYMAGMFAASASFSALLAFPLPYFLVEKELYRTGSSIAGWTGTKEIGRVTNMIVTDTDLFPDETVSISSVRIVDHVPPQLTLSYMCSLIAASKSCLVPAFMQLSENNDCTMFDVENFQCHEAGGLSGTIGPDEVLVASHSYMKLQGLRIPARKKDSENALFLAVNGHVIAYVTVDYKPVKSVKRGLEAALRGTVEMVFAARDFNITPLLISKKFKSPSDTLRFPCYSQRYEITDNEQSETATCAAVVSRKSFYSYASVVEKARNLYKSVSCGVTLSVASCVIGVVLEFVMAMTGILSVSRLLIFMLLWLIPTILIAISITK